MFIYFLIPLAISFTVNSLLGNVVGENKPLIAKNIVKITNITSLIYVFIFYILA